MRVPTLSLRVERGEESGLGELRAEAAGVALLLLLALDVLLGGGRGAGQMPDALRYAFCASAAVVLLAGGMADKRFHTFFRTRASVVTGVCVALPGSAISIAAAYVPGALYLPCQLVGGSLLGAGLALLVFLWGIAFARLESADVSLNAVAGVTFGVLAFVVAFSQLPAPWGHILAGALQLVHLYLLRDRVTDALPDPDMREHAYFGELQIHRGAFAWKFVPVMLFIGVVLGNVMLHAGFVLREGSGLRGLVATVAAAVLGSVAVLAAATHARRHDQAFEHVFRTILPLVAVLILPLMSTSTDALSIPVVSLLTALTMLGSVTWAYLGNFSQDFRLSPVFLFGLGQGSLMAGYVLAGPLNTLALPHVQAAMPASAFGLIASLVGLVVVAGLFPRFEDIRAIVVRSYAPSELWGADAEQEGSCARCARAETGRCAAQEALAAGAAQADAREEAAEDLPRSHAGTPYEAAATPAHEAGGAGAAEDARVRKGRFVRRCECVADTFLLSRRETDVLFLLAKGRNVGFIMQQLCISEGTAKTHVNHVYKKLGVHSRQELIELIDSFEG